MQRANTRKMPSKTFGRTSRSNTRRRYNSLIIEEGSLKEKTLEALKEENFKIIDADFRPTAENFAKCFYDAMAKEGYKLTKVTVYETPNNCATYSEQ